LKRSQGLADRFQLETSSLIKVSNIIYIQAETKTNLILNYLKFNRNFQVSQLLLDSQSLLYNRQQRKREKMKHKKVTCRFGESATDLQLVAQELLPALAVSLDALVEERKATFSGLCTLRGQIRSLTQLHNKSSSKPRIVATQKVRAQCM
jgi:hypothetical protein